ncbi:ABC transporter substrate-binding protein [Halorussus salinus]|uniref:ABC transporter substrate-binding protein n=1 Tax=Halorussus salinus TaxID=1364935 RepID=UPI00138F4EEE|nr:extracellular solute-binding protein [Halorussus salinus]
MPQDANQGGGQEEAMWSLDEATRRKFLASTALAGGMGLAGCASGNPAQDSTTTTTTTTESSSTDNTDETSETTEKPDSISLWNTYGKSDRASSKWIAATADAYTSKTDVDIQIQGHPERLTEKVLAAYKTGNAPDLVYDHKFDKYVTPGKVDESPLLEINEYTEQLQKETYDIVWPKVTFDGDVFGVPQTVNARNWFYNKSLVKQAGYDPETFEPQTLSDLEQAIKDITNNTDAKGWIWPGGATAYNWYFPAHFMRSWFGVEMTEPVVKLGDGTKGAYSELRGNHSETKIHAGEVVDVKVRVTSDEMKATVGWMKRMADQGYVPDNVLTADNGACMTKIFPSSKVGLYFSGPWAYSLLNKHVKDFEWAAFGPVTEAKLDGLSGSGYFTASAGKPLMIIDKSNSPDYAGQFIQEWFSTDRQKKFVQEVGSLSIRPELNTQENFEIPQLASLAEIVKDATYYSPPQVPADVDLWNTVGSVVQQIVSGSKELDPALKNLQSVLEDRYAEGLK